MGHPSASPTPSINARIVAIQLPQRSNPVIQLERMKLAAAKFKSNNDKKSEWDIMSSVRQDIDYLYLLRGFRAARTLVYYVIPSGPRGPSTYDVHHSSRWGVITSLSDPRGRGVLGKGRHIWREYHFQKTRTSYVHGTTEYFIVAPFEKCVGAVQCCMFFQRHLNGAVPYKRRVS